WVLPTEIPGKGAPLTALRLWWLDQIRGLVATHTVKAPVPGAVAGRAVVCRRRLLLLVGCLARGSLTGSGLAEYHVNREVCGVALPEGLVAGSRLPHPIFTPAAKAEVGEHDENVTFAEVERRIGAEEAAQLRDLTLRIYDRAHELAAA